MKPFPRRLKKYFRLIRFKGFALKRKIQLLLRKRLGSIAAKARRFLDWLPWPESLKLKLTLGMSALALCILTVTYYGLSYTARQAATGQAEDQSIDLLNFFSTIIAESVAANDRMQIHLQAQALLQKGVHALAIIDNNGAVLYASPAGWGEEAIRSAAGLKPYHDAMLGTKSLNGMTCLHATRPIRFGNSPLGMIHLWLDRTQLENRIQKANAFIYPIFIFGFLLMLLVSFWVFHTTFRTLKRMSHLAQRIGSGDLSVRVPVKGKDEVAGFCQAFNDMVDGLCKAQAEIQRNYLNSIQAMISAVEAKDSYTKGHCLRVQHYAKEIIEQIKGLSADQKSRIEIAALLHDIGKIGIPETILLKKKPLNRKELEIIRNHVTMAEKILQHLDSRKEIARWVRHHHERWDGLGYPDGLRGEAIPLASRIIAVADSIDAMRTHRPYRQALTWEETLETLAVEKGKQFDPMIVEHALAVLHSRVRQRMEIAV